MTCKCEAENSRYKLLGFDNHKSRVVCQVVANPVHAAFVNDQNITGPIRCITSIFQNNSHHVMSRAEIVSEWKTRHQFTNCFIKTID